MHHPTIRRSTPPGGRSRPAARFYRLTTYLTVFATLFGGLLFLLAPEVEANANAWESSGSGTRYVIDGALNLRAGPSTSHDILDVMPDGAPVDLTGESDNGFLGVVYNGTWGWAFAEFLAANQGAAPDSGGLAPVPVGDSVIGSGWVSDGPLNLRTGPSTSYTILEVMPFGAPFEIMGDSQDGFLPLRYGGTSGWSAAQFITVDGPTAPDPAPEESPLPETGNGDANPGSVPVPGTTPVGTAWVFDGALNLRTGPGTSYTIVTVMPDGAEVSLLGDARDGFAPVSYNGTTGWAYAGYLTTGGDTADPAPSDPAPAPNPGDDGVWTTDEIIQIIYAAADEYGQPREDMLRVARCESLLDPSNVNSSSGASGLFQFMPGTWLTTPFAEQDIFDPVANAKAAAWMWSVGRRNEWVCQ